MTQETQTARLFSGFALLVVATATMTSAAAQDQAVDRPQSFAVVELFTSQGCSSCPPADHLLRQIAENNERTGTNVYPLSFHVDYWNRLGWKDPFSSAEYTKRQRAYASLMRERGVYTPQMIVGGTTGFVGSDGKKAKAAIMESRNDQRVGVLIAKSIPLPNHEFKVDVTAGEIDDGTLINFALVQTEATTQVPRGENANRKL